MYQLNYILPIIDSLNSNTIPLSYIGRLRVKFI